MRVIVNGEPIETPTGLTLAELIEQRGLSDAACATELNHTLVPKNQRGEQRLNDGDRVEIVSLVGGG